VRLNLWRGLAGLATAAVVALAAFIFVAPEQPEAPLFAGEVRAEDASQRFVVTYDPDSGTVRLARAAGGAAPARSLELWAIYEGEDPVSLAVLPQDERFQFVVPEPMRQRFAEATLAISEEPEGGAPGGLPTGPIVAVGGITRL
jgi:anti-sigma-K factor RskA